jgi:late competence protein required for DNA uptake (superfamily II DNA/RNA helicase)
MRCDVCGKDGETFVAASTYGPISFAYCKECLLSGRESYNAVVMYIAGAGRFPDNLSEEYRDDVYKQLKLHCVIEEQFIKDVDECIEKYWKDYYEGKIQ